MSKRFTDTEKWGKGWFRKLSPKMKAAWLFLCDKCDHAGVWDFDDGAFEYFIGEDISKQELIESFGDRISFYENDKLVINSFIEFQYGTLNPDNRVHKSVLDKLAKFNTIKPLTSPLQGAKDKDKDKDKFKDKKKEEENLDFEYAYNLYPLKKGKSKGLDKLKRDIKTQSDLDLFIKSVENYKLDLELNKTQSKYFKHFSTFVNEWRDWLNYTPIQGIGKGQFSNSRIDMVDDFNNEIKKVMES